ncbi:MULTISPECIES: aryl-sulfate sulfotransferase N-terminal domain-containing protein [Blautia]|nr:aryl-sulfate sulfotransferase N-terminal domain-containing protein [uncultured Blautia sp.]
MLVKENPYGTNTLSLYVYFTTEDLVSVSYTVSVAFWYQ